MGTALAALTVDTDPAVRKALAANHTAQARQHEAEARKAELEADAADFAIRSLHREEAALLAADAFHRVYYFTGEVNAATVRDCLRRLTIWKRTEPGEPIEIVFTSTGGSIIDGMVLFDAIQELRRAGHHVTTSTLGMAASMAGILLQAGDERVMAKESWLLLHEASFGAGGSMGEVEDTVEWVKRVEDRILDIFAARSKLTKKQIATRWRRKDWWVSSDDALEFGFVDTVR